jgi:hypothetical protein
LVNTKTSVFGITPNTQFMRHINNFEPISASVFTALILSRSSCRPSAHPNDARGARNLAQGKKLLATQRAGHVHLPTSTLRTLCLSSFLLQTTILPISSNLSTVNLPKFTNFYVFLPPRLPSQEHSSGQPNILSASRTSLCLAALRHSRCLLDSLSRKITPLFRRNCLFAPKNHSKNAAPPCVRSVSICKNSIIFAPAMPKESPSCRKNTRKPRRPHTKSYSPPTAIQDSVHTSTCKQKAYGFRRFLFRSSIVTEPPISVNQAITCFYTKASARYLYRHAFSAARNSIGRNLCKSATPL